MVPKQIGSLLDKFSRLTPPDGARRKALSEAIESVVGIIVPVKDISIRVDTAYVKVTAAARSEIALHQSAILKQVRERLGDQARVTAIR